MPKYAEPEWWGGLPVDIPGAGFTDDEMADQRRAQNSNEPPDPGCLHAKARQNFPGR
jgi:hypothetical protein